MISPTCFCLPSARRFGLHAFAAAAIALSAIALLPADSGAQSRGRKRASTAAASQPADTTPQNASLTGIQATGVTGLTPADLLAATGLKPGVHTQAELQAASDVLAASGQYSNVGYDIKDGVLTFQLKPQDGTLPVHYENFVWWSEAELTRLVHAKAPLFLGSLGGKGTTLDAVQATLTALAQERAGKDAVVAGAPAGTAGEPPIAFGFTITQPPITVRQIRLSNTSFEMGSEVSAAERALQDQPYTRDTTEAALVQRLTEAYAGLGYYDFKMRDLHAENPQPAATGYSVVVTGGLVPGAQYTVSTIQWTATPQLSLEDFTHNTNVRKGEIAQGAKVDDTLRMIERNYRRQGYDQAKASVTATPDRAAHTVAFVFNIDSGSSSR